MSGVPSVPLTPRSAVVKMSLAARLVAVAGVERVDEVAGLLLEQHRPPAGPIAVGRTQASSVMPVVRSSESASATVTQSLMPLKLSAPPNLPPRVRVAPLIVPVLPRPDPSVAVVPDASSKPQAPTRFDTTGLTRERDRDRLRRAGRARRRVTVTSAV